MDISRSIEPIYNKKENVHYMASDIERETVRRQVDIYRQLREQLMSEMKRYRKGGKMELADIIARSVAA
jgi:hypothetical protein